MISPAAWPCDMAGEACFASPEQSPQTDHRRALRTWYNRKPEADQSVAELQMADTWIDQCFSFVVPGDDDTADLGWLFDKLASAVVRYDAKLIVIDPWNELDHAKPKDMTTTEYVGRAIREMKKFAKSWQVHLIVVAHPVQDRPQQGRVAAGADAVRYFRQRPLVQQARCRPDHPPEEIRGRQGLHCSLHTEIALP